MKIFVSIVSIILLQTSGFCQIETLMKSLNGKNIDFKYKFESVQADYSAETSTIVTKDNKFIDLYTLHSGYDKQNFVKSKIDLYTNGQDTIIYTYGFFKDRLFEIKFYSNSDSLSRLAIKNTRDFFKNIELVSKNNGLLHYESKKAVNDAYYYSFYNFDNNSKINQCNFTLTYEPIKKYLPLWCGTGKSKNWQTKMEKALTSH